MLATCVSALQGASHHIATGTWMPIPDQELQLGNSIRRDEYQTAQKILIIVHINWSKSDEFSLNSEFAWND